VGSIVALACSEIALAVCYGTGAMGTTAASAIAFVAGAIPNYLINRTWVWERKGRVSLGRELLPYVAISVISFAASALATGWASNEGKQLSFSSEARTAFVAAAYLITYGALFILKFVGYEVLVFRGVTEEPTETPAVDRSRRRLGRSRHQVPVMTREKRQP
jgi:putative flippase GtrA